VVHAATTDDMRIYSNRLNKSDCNDESN
jgi:hypothetical protein